MTTRARPTPGGWRKFGISMLAIVGAIIGVAIIRNIVGI